MNTILSQSCKAFLKTTYSAYRNGVWQALFIMPVIFNIKAAPHNWDIYVMFFCMCYTLAHYWIDKYAVNKQWFVKVALFYIIGLIMAVVALFTDARQMDLLYTARMRQEWIEAPQFIATYFFVPLYSLLFIYVVQRIKKRLCLHTTSYKVVTVIANTIAVIPIILLLICLIMFSVQ